MVRAVLCILLSPEGLRASLRHMSVAEGMLPEGGLAIERVRVRVRGEDGVWGEGEGDSGAAVGGERKEDEGLAIRLASIECLHQLLKNHRHTHTHTHTHTHLTAHIRTPRKPTELN